MGRLRTILTLLQLVTSKVQGSLLAINVPQAPSDGVSDTDGILTLGQRELLAKRIEDFQVSIPAGDQNANVQIVVAVIDRMNLPPEMEDEQGAGEYARRLHDAWGVGEETDEGGTGVLLFLSIYDRILYISRGGALEKFLTNSRIDAILRTIQPAMRQTMFADGFILAIDEVEHYILKGQPTWNEFFLDLLCFENFFVLVWVVTLLLAITKSSRQRRQQRAYAQAVSQLSEIDRAQAEALQGRFQATSCPICLESFKDTKTGSDDQPIRLLRCGHVFDESCWNEWVSSGQGSISRCPICKMDLAQPQEEEAITREENVTSYADASEVAGVGDPDVAIRRFQQDRNFRLVQLGMRYPSFITQTQIQRWSSPLYDGSLARDPVFRQHSSEEMARQSEIRRSVGSSTRSGNGGFARSSVSYGGGTSSGGRASRF
jgi:uncharacterized membrane protein YgcG